jgi:hypothetical protein
MRAFRDRLTDFAELGGKFVFDRCNQSYDQHVDLARRPRTPVAQW